ncbi:hypothetical protein [Roseibium polysiphoniae]|uniref:hypothetical protein n=1 Tax=Roseibium polysiphoniae TaxID=2571221 RepID=UPI001FE852BD|nr:hypothetical protein [Roseibium polysiphoniae]
MGHSAKLELFRRLVPLFLAVLGIVGALTFLSPLSGLLCVIAGIGIYCAMPKQRLPTGAVRPAVQPGVLVTDAIGYVIGVPLFCLSLLGAAYGTGSATSLLFLTLLIPASFSILIFMTAIRQETSWIRFFGNGFEVTQLGLKARVRYTDLSSMRVRQVRLSRGLGWFFATLGSGTRRRIALLGDAEDSKTLIFVSKGGTEFAVSSEMIPDLQRVLIGMDRAGVELPEGISERERKKIRRVRERMYRKPDEPNMEQLDVARIAATVRKYQQRNA